MSATKRALQIALAHVEVSEHEKKLQQEVKRARLDAEDWRARYKALVERTRVTPVTAQGGRQYVEEFDNHVREAAEESDGEGVEDIVR